MSNCHRERTSGAPIIALAESNSPTPLRLVGIHLSQAEDPAIADAARPEDVGLANNAALFNAQFIEDFKKLRQSY